MKTILLSLFAIFACASGISIGDRLLNGYTEYAPLPTTAAAASTAGWMPYNKTCDPVLGIPYALQADGPSTKSPLTIFFTSAGQVAGLGVTAFGSLPQNLIDQGFWQQVGDQTYFLSVTFRASGLCDGSTSSDVLGDQVTINAASVAWVVPTTEPAALQSSWVAGSCIASMGRHYFYDLSTPGNMTYQAANMLPVVTMYNNSRLNAIFFASPVIQQSLTSRNQWDGAPLPDFAMCYNWCDSQCTWHDTSFWSTMHIFMNDHTTVGCPDGCKLHCCPSSQD